MELNDPMEGRYLYNKHDGKIDEDMVQMLKGAKEKIRVCSLSRDPNNELMWSHYAEGHKGVAIGVEVSSNKYEVRPIIYNGLHQIGRDNFHPGSAVDVLSHKLDVWEYEEEERVFTKGKQHVDVKVRQIICGSRMSTQDKGFITDLVNKIDSSIEIINARTNASYV